MLFQIAKSSMIDSLNPNLLNDWSDPIPMLSDFAYQLNVFINQSKIYLQPWLMALGVLWIINILNWTLGSPLNRLGLVPRRLSGLPGILFSPFLHGDFSHLFFNSIPLFVLGLALLAEGPNIFFCVTVIIIILEGSAVWLVGRRARHIGASGVISGYFGYIIVHAYLHPSFTGILLALLVVYYFGSIFLGIFPQEDKISWESHLLGFLSGIAAAFLAPSVLIWMEPFLKSLSTAMLGGGNELHS